MQTQLWLDQEADSSNGQQQISGHLDAPTTTFQQNYYSYARQGSWLPRYWLNGIKKLQIH